MPVPLVADDYINVRDGYAGSLLNSNVWNGKNWNYNNGHYRTNWNGNRGGYNYQGAPSFWRDARGSQAYTAWRGPRGAGGYHRR